MTKFKSISSIVALVVTLITAIAVVVAWYTPADKVDDMSFNILQIDSLVTLYEAKDTNNNGVPDLQASANINQYHSFEAGEEGVGAYVDYKNMYHDENYSFEYIDQKYALSQDSKANLLDKVTIADAIPSKVYSYKFEITNYVGLENEITFSFIEDNEIDTTKLEDFEVRLGVVAADSSLTFTSWTPFCTNGIYSGITLNPLNSTMKVPAKTKNTAQTADLSVGRLDLWLQIKLKNEAVNDTIRNFILPLYKIELSCDMPDSQNSGD